jgi:hypothetical protein
MTTLGSHEQHSSALFGEWQTEPYVPPTMENVIIVYIPYLAFVHYVIPDLAYPKSTGYHSYEQLWERVYVYPRNDPVWVCTSPVYVFPPPPPFIYLLGHSILTYSKTLPIDKGIDKVARQLGMNYAPALVGWEYRKGQSYPSLDGIVVAAEHAELLHSVHISHFKKNSVTNDCRRYTLMSCR